MMKNVLLGIHSELSGGAADPRPKKKPKHEEMELADIKRHYVPSERDDAQEQLVEQTLNSVFDRGLIVNDSTNDETYDLKQYLETNSFRESMASGITNNDLDENEIPDDVFKTDPNANLVFGDKFNQFYGY